MLFFHRKHKILLQFKFSFPNSFVSYIQSSKCFNQFIFCNRIVIYLIDLVWASQGMKGDCREAQLVEVAFPTSRLNMAIRLPTSFRTHWVTITLDLCPWMGLELTTFGLGLSEVSTKTSILSDKVRPHADTKSIAKHQSGMKINT